MRTEVLDEAYARLHDMGPEFEGDEEGNNGLSNHGPMVAEVLVRRGFDESVPRWLDRYLPRLEGIRGPSEAITEENWRSALAGVQPDRAPSFGSRAAITPDWSGRCGTPPSAAAGLRCPRCALRQMLTTR